MPNHRKTPPPHVDQKPTRMEEEPLCSPGLNSPSVTPKDVSSEDASSKDMTERKINSEDLEEREEEMLDDAVDMTFPASDPIAIPTPDDYKDRQKKKSQTGQH